ncbi:recombinase family protein [Novosphingobium aquae]|uniref:Recombinase family protein n=1 Tax=Novosphingobium aquae TaxID=3133435 RepID=A0ABU8S6F9_9SPHN
MNKVRCAIYTRKSSEEGLEQSFNSLHAQHEACAAYVLSQASEGWTLLPEQYDDGGLSGGNLERPALQRLLGDIAAGKIDIVVVYKVDRLTRSLLDFAKLVEAFDKAGTSFVSITQSFNTTTSMGRLTLNMLLSFAQFEREVTAERIRDKLAASKARGMWMGGTPPIGYRPHERTLEIVEEQAEFVRGLFRRYLELRSVRLVADQLKDEGILSPRRTYGTGRASGGLQLSRGQIYQMLNNPVYIGRIRHKDKTYPGLHSAIIDELTWERTQQLLQEHTQGERRVRAARPSVLAGLAYDEAGDPLLATHACKPAQGKSSGKAVGGRHRYRYYVSRELHHKAGGSNHGLRIPARELEGAVEAMLGDALGDPMHLAASLGHEVDADLLRVASANAEPLAHKVKAKDSVTIRALVDRVTVQPQQLQVDLNSEVLNDLLGLPVLAAAPALPTTLTSPLRITRTGHVVRIVQQDGKAVAAREPDPALLKLLARARALWSRLESGDIDIATLAREEQINDSYATRLVRLAFLSPTIIDAITVGEQPAGLNAIKLLNAQISADWDEQARRFGFA